MPYQGVMQLVFDGPMPGDSDSEYSGYAKMTA